MSLGSQPMHAEREFAQTHPELSVHHIQSKIVFKLGTLIQVLEVRPTGGPAVLAAQDRLSPLQALWAQFKPDPAVVDPESWTMSKLGSPISPLEVVLNGSQSMHAVDDEGIWVQGMGLQRSWEQLQIRQASSSAIT